LCSEDTLREIGDSVEFDECVEVRAKGFREVIRTFSVRGFDAEPELSMPRRIDEWVTLAQEVPARFHLVVQKQLGQVAFLGQLLKLSHGEAEIRGIVQEGCPLQPTGDAKACPLLQIPRLTDLALFLNSHELVGRDEPIYAQVTQLLGNEGILVRFTSVSPMQRRLLDRLFASASQDGRAPYSRSLRTAIRPIRKTLRNNKMLCPRPGTHRSGDGRGRDEDRHARLALHTPGNCPPG
jgi:hypothetical protein